MFCIIGVTKVVFYLTIDFFTFFLQFSFKVLILLCNSKELKMSHESLVSTLSWVSLSCIVYFLSMMKLALHESGGKKMLINEKL